MNTAIGFIGIVSLITIAIKELIIAQETSIYRNAKKFLDITIFVLVALFACLVTITIIDILLSS